MKNLLKNRIVVGLICIIVALVICFGLTPMFNDALTSTVEIVRVNAEIKEGDQITAKMVTSVEVGGYNLPSNVVYRTEDQIRARTICRFSAVRLNFCKKAWTRRESPLIMELGRRFG